MTKRRAALPTTPTSKACWTTPNFVGAHWFQYVDQPATGRTADGENAGSDLVTITDTPHQEFIEAVRATNATIYPYRFSK